MLEQIDMTKKMSKEDYRAARDGKRYFGCLRAAALNA